MDKTEHHDIRQDEWPLDAAIANGIFNPDHFAMPLDRLTAYNPDGQPIELQNQAKLNTEVYLIFSSPSLHL